MRVGTALKVFAIISVYTGVLLIGGCGKSTGNQPQAGPPEVAVIEAKPERIAMTTELNGRTSAYLIAEVRPQVSGIIQKRLFTEGGDVKAGSVLYQIDPATYQAAYDSARATLAKAEANLITIRLKADRYKELVAIKAVSQQDYDDISAALKQAEAEVMGSKAAVETAHINLTYTRVNAPIDGRIGRSSVTTGALVTASQPTPLATIQKIDPVYVDVTQSSADLLQLQQNMASGRLKKGASGQAKVKLILENNAPYPLEGVLQFRDVTVDQTTGTFILRIVFPNPKGVLLPGMYVRAVLEEGVNENAILIPQQAVSRDTKGNPLCLIVDGENKVQIRMLTIERAIADKWLITAGLAAGDKIIAEGIQKARPGSPVKAVPFVESASDKKSPDGKMAAKPAATTAPGAPAGPVAPGGEKKSGDGKNAVPTAAKAN